MGAIELQGSSKSTVWSSDGKHHILNFYISYCKILEYVESDEYFSFDETVNVEDISFWFIEFLYLLLE